MTDNEIIRALKCCKGEAVPCSECIYADFGQCQIYMADDALKLIKRQQAEKEALIAGQETLQKAIAEKDTVIADLQHELFCYKETNEHLNNEYGALSRECDRLKEQIEKLQTVIFKKEDTAQILHKEHQETVYELQEAKAEIESLGSRIFALNDTNKILMETQKVYVNNMLKEFAERLKEKSVFLEDGERYIGDAVKVKDIDDLVKEMTERSNETVD